MKIPPPILDATTTLATLLGIVLGFDAIAQATRDSEPVAWGVFGLVVAILSAVSLGDRVFNFFGNPDNAEGRRSRLLGGGMTWFLFLTFAAVVGLFRFVN